MLKKQWGFALFAILLTMHSFSQQIDSARNISHFSGSVSLTQNGISVVPSFSLGKPAVIFNLSMGKRLTFEPEMRFALEGKPWSFLFWWRYKLVRSNKFALNIGAHPALNFITQKTVVGSVEKESIVARRFLAGEISSGYQLTKNVRVGMYYLHALGFEKEVAKKSNFITLNATLSHQLFSEQYTLRFSPQVFYLNLDEQSGFYYNANLALSKAHSPFSVAVMINKTIQSDIANNKDFIWNVSLIYTFDKKLLKL